MLEAASLWSWNNSLVCNDDKIKKKLFPTTQLSQTHNLKNNEWFKVIRNSEAIERVNTKKSWEFILMKTYPGHLMYIT